MSKAHKILAGAIGTMVIGAILIDLGIWATGSTCLSLGFIALIAGPVAADL